MIPQSCIVLISSSFNPPKKIGLIFFHPLKIGTYRPLNIWTFHCLTFRSFHQFILSLSPHSIFFYPSNFFYPHTPRDSVSPVCRIFTKSIQSSSCDVRLYVVSCHLATQFISKVFFCLPVSLPSSSYLEKNLNIYIYVFLLLQAHAKRLKKNKKINQLCHIILAFYIFILSSSPSSRIVWEYFVLAELV